MSNLQSQNSTSERTVVVIISKEKDVLYFNESAKTVLGDDSEVAAFLKRPHISQLLERVIADRTEQSMRCILPNKHFYEMFAVPIISKENLVSVTILWQLSEALENWTSGDKNIPMIQAIIDAVADGVIIVDAKGFVRHTNKSYELMSNIQKEHYVNQHVDTLKKNGLIHQGLSPTVVERKEPISIIDFRNGKDMLITGTPLFGSYGEVIGVLCNVRDVSELRSLKEQLSVSKKIQEEYLKQLQVANSSKPHDIVNTSNPKMKKVVDTALRVASTNSTVLLLGESGVGKGVIANFIHQSSKRNDKPMVEINCGSIPPNLCESELFGYESGAFTGASKAGKPGIFELANNSTLFLDEIGDLPLDMQVKVLKAIQDKTVMRIGGNKPINLDVRIIAATNRNLEEMINEKTFREDLYYRLSVIPIEIPSLRDRTEDIMALTTHFMKKLNKEYSMNKRMSPKVIEAFLNYPWPGNIRELENTVERMLVTSINDEILLPEFFNIKGIFENNNESKSIPLQDILDQEEKRILLETYRNTNSTRKSAAILGISQSAFMRKAKKHNIPLV